ncbi:XRE family transcriptional regulator [Caulobacter sp. S45]|uniref:XRE family transcriptional regulator n=1 Tax=Caulobacter sp. S45 TaxID=1641861 RepID=UPI00131DDBEE|nr:XRE family transcriptional regulator [Caulobacter sp. S45]
MRNLALALRAVRRYRQQNAKTVASAMGMPLRSYQHFEAGRGRLNIDSIFRFAEATDSDPLALLAAAIIGAPQFAVHCADNKLATILRFALEDFEARAGSTISALKAVDLFNTFGVLFDDLATQAERESRGLDELLAEYNRKKRDSSIDGS